MLSQSLVAMEWERNQRGPSAVLNFVLSWMSQAETRSWDVVVLSLAFAQACTGQFYTGFTEGVKCSQSYGTCSSAGVQWVSLAFRYKTERDP